MDWFVYPVVFGIVSSVFFAVGIWLIQQYRYWRKLRMKFHNTTYQTFHKYFPNKIIQEVKITVNKNIIHFEGKRMSDETPFNGQFIVNPINLKIADGYHNHTNDEGFGFMNMIINGNDEFLIEAPYTKMYYGKNEKTGVQHTDASGIRIYQAFVWRKK
jgi:hypothetical protein